MTDRELLVDQLASALADAAAGRDDYFEVAALAGLLTRFAAATGDEASAAEQAVLAQAREQHKAGTLRAGLPAPATASDLVESILEEPGDYDELDRRELLLDMDELCAGAWFVGEPNHFVAAIRTLAAAVLASPADWIAQSVWVERVLAIAPPHPGDCMLEIFRLLVAVGADARAERAGEGASA